MKYKVGDEVLVKVQIVEDSVFGYRLKTTDGILITAKKDGVIPIPDMTAEEAWEIAKKLKQMTKDELLEAFRTNVEYLVLRDFTPQKAKAKIEAWEAEKEIKIGDVVKVKNDQGQYTDKAVVTRTWEDACVNIMYDDGITGFSVKGDLKKTGRHIDIDGLLKQIEGTSDGKQEN